MEEGAVSQRTQSLEAGQGKEKESPQSLQKSMQPCQHLDFSLKPLSVFQPTELGENTHVLFYATDDVVTGYSSNRKLNSRDEGRNTTLAAVQRTACGREKIKLKAEK